jgi:hypothetical protein
MALLIQSWARRALCLKKIVDSGISKSCGFSTKKDELGIYLKKRR